MKKFMVWGCLILALLSTVDGADKNKFRFTSDGARAQMNTTFGVTWAKRIQQGFNLKLWLSSQMAMGIEAWDPFAVPPNTCATPGIGMEYPAGSCIEHLFGAAPVIGGIINGRVYVDVGYNDDARMVFLPEKQDTTRDKIWRTQTGPEEYHPNGDGYSGYYYIHGIRVNRRGVDDDGDGRIDEDELDGQDNDGDWNPLIDDIGADGLPDSLEVSCDGKPYDAVTNPDPAYDDYDPARYDSCHPVSPGIYRLKNDKNLYTERNGMPDHGEPHVDEDYGAQSDQDIYIGVTDTFTSYFVPGHIPMGIKIFQKTYAWRDPSVNAIIPMDYLFTNVGRDTIEKIYLGMFADFDVGPVSVPGYPAHNYKCYMPDVRCGYINNSVDSGSTPAGLVFLGGSKPLDSLQIVWQGDFVSGLPVNDSILYFLLNGIAEPGNLIAPCQSPSSPADARFWFAFGPFGTLKPGDTVRMSVAFVSGMSVADMANNAQRAIDLYNNHYVLSVRNEPPPLPTEYRLDQNHPNPFNPSTEVTYSLEKASNVILKVYDLLGREVATLVNGGNQPGEHSVTWNAQNVPSGVYFYRLSAGTFVETKKMVVMK